MYDYDFYPAAGRVWHQNQPQKPEAVVKSLISAYQNQDEEAVKKAFGVNPDKKCAKEIQKEIDYNMDYFKAHEADKVEFRKSKSLGKFDKYELVYVWYDYKGKKTEGDFGSTGDVLLLCEEEG